MGWLPRPCTPFENTPLTLQCDSKKIIIAMKKAGTYPNRKPVVQAGEGCAPKSGLKVKAHFITACIFDRELRVVKIDKAVMDYYMRLTTFHSQFRAIGTNYNQITKAIKATFTEKKALAFLYQVEKATMELVAIHKKVLDLTDEFERKYLTQNT
jgi:hypothetical protein